MLVQMCFSQTKAIKNSYKCLLRSFKFMKVKNIKNYSLRLTCN